MIPVSMKISDPQLIISRKVFMGTKIVPLAIQKDENNNKIYKILFKFTETVSNDDIFFEARISIEDSLDKNYIESRSLYIDNIKKNENKFKAFKEVMSEFNSEKFYIGDFRFDMEESNQYIDAYKQVKTKDGKVYYEAIKIYISRIMFIILSLYTEDLLDPYSEQEKEFLFISGEMNNLRFEKAEDIKLIATSKRQLEDNNFSYNTMYEMNCGPTCWKFVYEIITPEDLELKEPLDYSIFDPEYSQYYNNFIGSVTYKNEFVYIITRDKNNKVVAVKVSNELINKTNIINPYNIFVEEFDNEEGDE